MFTFKADLQCAVTTRLGPVEDTVRVPLAHSRGILELFFGELSRRGIPYVILHSYEHLPDVPDGADVDYAVPHSHLSSISAVLGTVARAVDWAIVQNLQHHVFGFCTVLVDPEAPTQCLKLDVCSHYGQGRHLLVPDHVLLNAPRRHRTFSVPAPASEFIYLVAKCVARQQLPIAHLERLEALAALDEHGAQRGLDELFGPTGRSVQDWLTSPPADWATLGALMRARTRYGPALFKEEARRWVRRIVSPPGLLISVLGPDGVGKSTLIGSIGRSLAPCFTHQRRFKFLPSVWRNLDGPVDSTPHVREPRGWLVSCAKLLYYFADWWLGHLILVLPAKWRGAVIVFDRDFSDLVVDQRRYLVRGVGTLARLLRRLAPRADVTFVLDADPHTVHARKPELPVTELHQLRQSYRRFAEADRRTHLVPADDNADLVALRATRTRPSGARLARAVPPALPHKAALRCRSGDSSPRWSFHPCSCCWACWCERWSVAPYCSSRIVPASRAGLSQS